MPKFEVDIKVTQVICAETEEEAEKLAFENLDPSLDTKFMSTTKLSEDQNMQKEQDKKNV